MLALSQFYLVCLVSSIYPWTESSWYQSISIYNFLQESLFLVSNRRNSFHFSLIKVEIHVTEFAKCLKICKAVRHFAKKNIMQEVQMKRPHIWKNSFFLPHLWIVVDSRTQVNELFSSKNLSVEQDPTHLMFFDMLESLQIF